MSLIHHADTTQLSTPGATALAQSAARQPTTVPAHTSGENRG